MYLIETHLHTKQVSQCGWLYAEELAARYHAAGYHAIAVTDHYNVDTWNYLNIDPKRVDNVMPQFVEGFERLREACAQYDILVYLGAELRFYENPNDYLFYGFAPELLTQPHEIMAMGVAAFSQMARAAGALLIQAHPFRRGCIPLAPMLLDGTEVYNANPRHLHHGRNDMAQAMALREGEGFIRIAGSDCHRIEDVARSGIRSAVLPADTHAFADLLRSQNYELIMPE